MHQAATIQEPSVKDKVSIRRGGRRRPYTARVAVIRPTSTRGGARTHTTRLKAPDRANSNNTML